MREKMQRTGRAYAAIPNAALRDVEISMEARGLLALLMTYSDDWVFRKGHLLEITGWGRDKFEKHMGELRSAQYVELVQDRDTTGRVLGSTWIIRDAGNRGPENQCVGETTEALNFSDTEALKNQHPVKPAPGKSAPIRRTILKENQEEETQGFFDKVQEAEKPKDDGFNDFWEAYPKCPRKTGKPQAHQAWCRIISGKAKEIPKTDAKVIIEAVKRFAASGQDPQFIPLPTTWLNGARWDQFQAPVGGDSPRPPGRPSWGEVVR